MRVYSGRFLYHVHNPLDPTSPIISIISLGINFGGGALGDNHVPSAASDERYNKGELFSLTEISHTLGPNLLTFGEVGDMG